MYISPSERGYVGGFLVWHKRTVHCLIYKMLLQKKKLRARDCKPNLTYDSLHGEWQVKKSKVFPIQTLYQGHWSVGQIKFKVIDKRITKTSKIHQNTGMNVPNHRKPT